MRGSGGRASIMQSYRFLRAVLNTAVRDGAIVKNPCMPVIDAVNAYVIGAVRREITERRAERATGMDKKQWQAAHQHEWFADLIGGRPRQGGGMSAY